MPKKILGGHRGSPSYLRVWMTPPQPPEENMPSLSHAPHEGDFKFHISALWTHLAFTIITL